MSEHSTHVAVYEDSTRFLMNHPDQFPKTFMNALSKQYDFGMVSCGTRGNAVFAIPIIDQYRDGNVTDQALGHIAGALGWISHRAADSQLNFLADQIDEENNPFYTGQDLKLYYDAIVVKHVYQSGVLSTESENEVLSEATLAYQMHSNPASLCFDMDRMEWLYVNTMMRDVLGLQGFNRPSPPHGELLSFLETHDSRSQYYGENLPLYIKAFENPDPTMMHAVDYRINFYNPDDELIRYVRALQNDEAIDIDVDSALEKASSQSHYAKSLRLNIDFWTALGKYFDRQVDREELDRVLEKRFA